VQTSHKCYSNNQADDILKVKYDGRCNSGMVYRRSKVGNIANIKSTVLRNKV